FQDGIINSLLMFKKVLLTFNYLGVIHILRNRILMMIEEIITLRY
ncbi:hypothetical protein Anas_12858, partial [Armadillidium nasatum]